MKMQTYLQMEHLILIQVELFLRFPLNLRLDDFGDNKPLTPANISNTSTTNNNNNAPIYQLNISQPITSEERNEYGLSFLFLI